MIATQLKHSLIAQKQPLKHLLLSAGLSLFAFNSYADIEISQDLSDLTEAERAWLEDDSGLDAITVNGGQLNWLTEAQTAGQYGLENSLTVTQTSLTDGWVTFTQCHNNLDPIRKIVVQYNSNNTRGLTLQSSEKIESVNIDESNRAAVLIGVKKHARVCISGESKSLEETADGYLVKRGPYMRKFLDGYYPMALKETIKWQQTDLKLNTTGMQTQLGQSFDYSGQSKTLIAQYWFEGRLSPRYVLTED
ncbi:MAG: hypothetical protein JXK16_07170 [Thiotrichales bacterium]|nr:hypothetical protein [Thiotrichales bacterium]